MYRYILFAQLLALLFILACQGSPYKQGEIMYGNFCASCHMDDGSGLRGRIPPLANSDYLKKYPSELACIIRYGKTGEIEVNGKKYQEPMPGVPQLSDFEIANIINYINQAWGNESAYVPVQKVQQALEKCK
ncbi:MAG TPA: cytochrome c [Haliscomenobacter sp.]|uniref:c-type cytochrome n=1 Tax=Haliscomenobacter sp. TaxID=2717303 RepID=UPI002CDB2EF0|nr:cytochrome c [Haliscomenobacter sp.]HOY16078.1 cytochrome c [Haliscomenobacter sp.]